MTKLALEIDEATAEGWARTLRTIAAASEGAYGDDRKRLRDAAAWLEAGLAANEVKKATAAPTSEKKR